jgi:hypothetical protein
MMTKSFENLRARLKIIRRVAMVITFAITFYLGRVFSHPNAWFMRATETDSPSPGGEGRGEGGLQTKIQLHFKIFRQALNRCLSELADRTAIQSI